MLSPACIKSSFVFPSESQPCPGWSSVLMAPQNVPGPSAPPHLTPPPGFMEYFSLLVQNGQFPPSTNQTLTPPVPPTPTLDVPPSESRSFTRVGRGQGGALVDKLKASKEVTAPSRKRKSLVEPDVEVQLPSTPTPIVKNAGKRTTTKRPKTTKVWRGRPETIALLTKPKHSNLANPTQSYQSQSRLKALIKPSPCLILTPKSLRVRCAPVTPLSALHPALTLHADLHANSPTPCTNRIACGKATQYRPVTSLRRRQ